MILVNEVGCLSESEAIDLEPEKRRRLFSVR